MYYIRENSQKVTLETQVSFVNEAPGLSLSLKSYIFYLSLENTLIYLTVKFYL
jgi:hypothetical protein